MTTLFGINDFKNGNAGARAKLNAMLSELKSLSKIRGDEEYIKVTKGQGGVVVSLNFDALISLISRVLTGVSPMIITAIGDDTLTCSYLYPDPDEEGGLLAGDTAITVLKPWTLRRTPFDGETVNGVSYVYTSAQEREADYGTGTETQFLTQDYFIGAIIYVKPVNEAGYDVIDDNNDARAWGQG